MGRKDPAPMLAKFYVKRFHLACDALFDQLAERAARPYRQRDRNRQIADSLVPPPSQADRRLARRAGVQIGFSIRIAFGDSSLLKVPKPCDYRAVCR